MHMHASTHARMHTHTVLDGIDMSIVNICHIYSQLKITLKATKYSIFSRLLKQLSMNGSGQCSISTFSSTQWEKPLDLFRSINRFTLLTRQTKNGRAKTNQIVRFKWVNNFVFCKCILLFLIYLFSVRCKKSVQNRNSFKIVASYTVSGGKNNNRQTH